jgi:AraC family transcriptional activator of pyochelin receptor
MPLSEYDIECVKKAKALIDADLSVHYSIAHIASVAGIGATKLKKGFKESYGSSLYAYLREQRMIQAAALLAETGKTLKQVAKTTGFHYTNNFSIAFTKYHKVSPAAYRLLKKEK